MDSVQVQIQGPEKLLSFGTELKLSKIYHANVSAHLPQTGLWQSRHSSHVWQLTCVQVSPGHFLHSQQKEKTKLWFAPKLG